MTCNVIKTKMLSEHVRGGLLVVKEGGRRMVVQKFHVQHFWSGRVSIPESAPLQVSVRLLDDPHSSTPFLNHWAQISDHKSMFWHTLYLMKNFKVFISIADKGKFQDWKLPRNAILSTNNNVSWTAPTDERCTYWSFTEHGKQQGTTFTVLPWFPMSTYNLPNFNLLAESSWLLSTSLRAFLDKWNVV